MCRDGRGAGYCFQTSDLPASARDSGSARDGDMAYVAGAALSAALKRAAGNDPCSDTRGGLEENHIVHVGPALGPFPQGHDVYVIVDKYGNRKRLLNVGRHVEAVPSGHDGRAGGLA